MALETYLIPLLSSIFAFIGGLIAIRIVFPRLADVLDGVIDDEPMVSSIIVFLTVFVWVTVLGMVVNFLGSMNANMGKYLGTVKPVLDVINSLVPYFEWLVVGVGALLLVVTWKKH